MALQRFRPGRNPLSRLNAVVDRVNTLAGPPSAVDRLPGLPGLGGRTAGTVSFWARLDGETDTDGEYTFREVYRLADDTWQDAPNGWGANGEIAFEIAATAGVADDTIVRMWSTLVDTAEGYNDLAFAFAAPPHVPRYGKPTAAYTSGATITLDPCDAAGVDNGRDNVTVQADWTLPANTEIPTSAIIPFTLAADGNWYAIGQGREVVTNIQYDTSNYKLQKKVRMDFGAFSTTESSAWVDITTAVDCTGV